MIPQWQDLKPGGVGGPEGVSEPKAQWATILRQVENHQTSFTLFFNQIVGFKFGSIRKKHQGHKRGVQKVYFSSFQIFQGPGKEKL